MLCDKHNRIISYLRISVTDRCNFRCVYCLPADGIEWTPRAELLTFEEIARVARAGAALGLSKIRLTGGEPTVRRDLPVLVSMLRQLDGICEVSLTTNAARLDELAAPLRAAGLGRLNISLDTLHLERAFAIARRDVFAATQRGIDAALAAGFPDIKFNTVVMRGVNDDELADLVAFAHERGGIMRFIEYMPMGQARFDERNKLVTAAEMRARLSDHFNLVPDSGQAANDAARNWVCRRSGARVGFISSMSEHFCEGCNRMRLTAQGGLRPCLHQDAEVEVRAIVRSDGSDAEIEANLVTAFRRAAALKWAGHHINDAIPLFSAKEMVAIGG